MADEYGPLLKKLAESPPVLELIREVMEDTELLQGLKYAFNVTVLTFGWLGAYAAFLAIWSKFDLFVEMLVMKELRLTPQEASILCGSLNFGAKINILSSLLARNHANSDGIRLLKKAHSLADRNSFAHGFTHSEGPSYLRTKLIKREVKDKYKIVSKSLDVEDLAKHIKDFGECFLEAGAYFHVSPEDILAYQKAIVDDGLAQASAGKHYPESLANSPTSSRKEPP